MKPRVEQFRFSLIRRLVPAVLFASLMLSGPLLAQTFTVNSPGDDAVAELDGECDTGSLIGSLPECTLRAALQEAGHAGPTVVNIHFNIAGCPDDLCVIEIDTQEDQSLPPITTPVILDGSTQPGNADVCQSDITDRSAYRIALQGTGAKGIHGLHLESGSDGSVIRGLNIHHFEHGIALIGSNDNQVECNAIGTDNTGMAPGPGNLGAGVFLACDSSGNVIGGPEPEQGNLIAANEIDGVQFFGGFICGAEPEDNMPVNNAVLGNQIGIAADGTSPLGNLWDGIAIFGGPGADNNLIGVLQDQETIRGNVIGFNGAAGLYIDSDGLQDKPTENTLVVGNYFGTDRDGLVDLGNQIGGIDIIRGAMTMIGGPGADEANVFAFNGDGIYMERQVSEQNRIQRNVMYSNEFRGIILQGGHPSDPKGTGPNMMQAAPAMSNTFKEDGIVSITYAVPDQEVNFPLVIEFFLADGDREQGQLFLIEHDYPTAGDSTLTFSSTQIEAGEFLVATATDSEGNTSEFSAVSEVLGEKPIEDDLIFQDRFQ